MGLLPTVRARVLEVPRLRVAAGVLFVQVLLLAGFLVDWRLPLLATAGFVIGVFLLDRPAWAVCGMLAARLLSTGTTSFFSIGRVQIGLFEPVLLFALIALGLRAALAQKRLWVSFPWKPIHLAVLGWNVVGLAWCVRVGDGLKDVLGLGVILATSSVIVAFIDTWERFRGALWTWIVTCVVIGLLAVGGDALGLTDYGAQWKASASGGRETGLGQQPNWFAMNLMFVIHACFAFALVHRSVLARAGLFASGVFVTLAMLTSGSRGAAYSVVIGAGIVALGLPRFRVWALRLALVAGVTFGLAWAGLLGEAGRGFNRIAQNVDVIFARDIRGMNWAACVGMFTETSGLGIGPGGYIDNLQKYSDWLYHSVYRYPHGIFWGQLAHGGVVGVLLLFALVASVTRMAVQTVRDCRGTVAEPLAWAMPASLAGYFCWSFVEFNIDEKPAWEWLALLTCLHLLGRAHARGEVALPARKETRA